MAKKDDTQKLEEALAYFQAGKSLRECEKLTGIGYKRVERAAKSRGIAQGSVSQLIVDVARVQNELVTKSVTVQRVVSQEADKLAELQRLHEDTALNSARAANNFSRALHISSEQLFAAPGIIDEEAVMLSGKVAQLTKITNEIVLPSLPKEKDIKSTASKTFTRVEIEAVYPGDG